MCVCIYIYIYLRMCVCVSLSFFCACACVSLCVCVCVCVCVCLFCVLPRLAPICAQQDPKARLAGQARGSAEMRQVGGLDGSGIMFGACDHIGRCLRHFPPYLQAAGRRSHPQLAHCWPGVGHVTRGDDRSSSPGVL